MTTAENFADIWCNDKACRTDVSIILGQEKGEVMNHDHEQCLLLRHVKEFASQVREKSLMEAHPERKPVDPLSGGHINTAGEFQSDKYPWCAPGFVPLKIKDAAAAVLLETYALGHEFCDSDFTKDLLKVLGKS